VCLGSFLFFGTKNWFALQDFCVCCGSFILFSGTKFGFALQDFFCVVDHFCSLKQWVGMSFLADFCDDGSKP
jgi:hypothetical protein